MITIKKFFFNRFWIFSVSVLLVIASQFVTGEYSARVACLSFAWALAIIYEGRQSTYHLKERSKDMILLQECHNSMTMQNLEIIRLKQKCGEDTKANLTVVKNKD